jgi:predicted RNA-binding Zn ribbon-like protein
MLFAHDTEDALLAAVALVNSESPEETLTGAEALAQFLRQWGWTGSRRGDARELAEVRALRTRLRGLWALDVDGVVTLVNEMLREAHALPQLVTHDDYGYHMHATSAEAPLVDRMAVEAAMALVDVVRMDELARLRVCAAEGCGDVLVDLSKNRSRLYCSTTCANRTNAAAFRARRSHSGADPR